MKKILKLFLLLCFLIPIPHAPFFTPLLSALSLEETLSALAPISRNNDAQFRWDPLLQNGVFNMGEHFGVFSAGAKEGETGFLVYNNRELFDVPLPYSNNGSLVFPEAFVDTLKNAFTRSLQNEAVNFRVSTIIIDAGHGGRDPGAVSKHSINGRNVEVREKDIVLNVALRLRDMLTRTYPDKNILMTRDRDVYLTLEQRTEIANAVTVRDNESVIFISIHANWGANANARGYEVWHITSDYRRSLIDPSRHNFSQDILAIHNAMLEEEFTTGSILLANSILQGLGKELGSSVPSRGRKANNWFVVRNSHMPSVLVELGFVSNRQDAVLMTSEEGLHKLTTSVYNGINNFIGVFER